MIIITAAWQASPGKENELKKHLQNMVDAVKKNEPDCLMYALHQSPTDASQFLFYEQYKDALAVERHTSTAHFKKLLEDTRLLIAKEVDVKFYDFIY